MAERVSYLRLHHQSFLLIALFSLTTLGIVGWVSRLSLLYVLTDGVIAVGIFIASGLMGLGITWAFKSIHRTPIRWQLFLSLGLGLGTMSLLVLTLGSWGFLQRPLWIGILIVAAIAGLVGLARMFKLAQSSTARHDHPGEIPFGSDGKKWLSWMILALVPAGAVSLLVTTVPPGILWQEEARGYDALEYHLQVPKEYFHAGQIRYLPHNIYANFPMNAEMLYLLAMVLKADPIEASILCHFLNVLYAAIFVGGAWLAGREYHPHVGLVCALVAGSLPWLMYLCGVAFVENGMLCFGMLALACLCRWERLLRQDKRWEWLWVLLGGLLAGFSSGFKYTALPMIALPFGLTAGLACLRKSNLIDTSTAQHEWVMSLNVGWRSLSLFLLGALLSFSPWLIKNAVHTGNPIFPLGYHVFGAKPGIWTDELARHWVKGHQVPEIDQPLIKRLIRLKQRVLLDPRIGPLLFCFILPVLLNRNRCYWDWMLLLILNIQMVVWLMWTHLFARFAVVLAIPIVLLVGRSYLANSSRFYRASWWVFLGITLVMNTRSTLAFYRQELWPEGKHLEVYGRFDLLDGMQDDDMPLGYVKQYLPSDKKILLIGEARAFYWPKQVDYHVVFSRHPFAEALPTLANDEEMIEWLNDRGYRYLVINWQEIERLRRTYGYWKEIAPALFERLERSGLAVVKQFLDPIGRPWATLYEIRETNNVSLDDD